MMARFTKRMLTEVDKRLLYKFVFNFGLRGMIAVNRFQKRLQNGEFFPAFLFLSITNKCNLSCQGCWVSPTKPSWEMDIETCDKIIRESKAQGSHFFGILGGEPLLHQGLFELFKKHPDCYFLLFTNGTLIDQNAADLMNILGNVSPLISIEGNESVSDQRRGGSHVYSRTMNGLAACQKAGLITGVATSVCKSNIDDLLTETFINELVDGGVHYLWYYIYRPVGPNPSPELSLDPEQIIQLRRFMVDVRDHVPLLIVDAYWDHQGRALCPAGIGIGHHINPRGDIEPCPPIQFAKDNIEDGKSIFDVFNGSTFLKEFRGIVSETTRGCILMERPDLLEEILQHNKVMDTSGRGTGFKELTVMAPKCSHHMPGLEIPEKHWLYRFAKKNWFFGFGAYG